MQRKKINEVTTIHRETPVITYVFFKYVYIIKLDNRIMPCFSLIRLAFLR